MIRLARAKPVAIVMACEKCFKRTHAKDKLTKPLKRALKPHRIKLVKTRCLGVCPRDAVTLHDSRKPREWAIVAHGTPADEVAALFLETVG
ncbi:(2Fe-2S) ferredoxin domain-containing protein [Sphingomonas sp. SUN039]|uniref:(2Fe-2S) ferredoxin domain-containing protein n=1 Tax=Sphingomonas sp. SUN039 TaxID=2937787 RepID=UPI0021641894|nr:(2Fe-2S) ferredoxin domain-containing protein [Sphingomonas sp. SUN039]UVO53839.1 (2Fe-2S) ferredoxin domain-containing protein [Sphingomonas sp. SUN039]